MQNKETKVSVLMLWVLFQRMPLLCSAAQSHQLPSAEGGSKAAANGCKGLKVKQVVTYPSVNKLASIMLYFYPAMNIMIDIKCQTR